MDDDDFTPDIRMTLEIDPPSHIEMGMRALGLKPYLLVELDQDDEGNIVLVTRAGGMPGVDPMAEFKDLVTLVAACAGAAPDDVEEDLA